MLYDRTFRPRTAFLAVVSAVAFVWVTPRCASAQPDCFVYLELTDPVLAGYLEVRLDYAAAGGDIYMPGLSPQCSALAGGGFATAVASPQEKKAEVTLATIPPGVTGPIEFARCGFVLDDVLVEPLPGDFSLSVLEARTSSFLMLDPLPTATVSRVVCPVAVTTTTLPVTTTLPSTTTTTLPDLRDVCTLTLRLEAALQVKTLNFDVYYTAVAGEFAGAGSGVECEGLIAGALNGFIDLDALRRVSINVGHGTGYSGPADLAVCNYLREPGSAGPAPDEFAPYVLYAADPGGATITPSPSVIVSEVSCPPQYATTTTILETPPTTTTSTSTTITTLPVSATCGDANADALLSATDGLYALRAAVGSITCARCRCDADSNGTVSASDAQRILKRATGQSVTMNCPPCP